MVLSKVIHPCLLQPCWRRPACPQVPSCSGGSLSLARRRCDHQGRPSGALQLGKGAPGLWMGAKGRLSFTLCTLDAALEKSRRGKKHTGNTLLCESLLAEWWQTKQKVLKWLFGLVTLGPEGENPIKGHQLCTTSTLPVLWDGD